MSMASARLALFTSVKALYFRPQAKFAKVMFLDVSVILSTGGGCLLRGGGCLLPWVCLLQEGLLGVCLLRGVPAPGGCLLLGDAWWRPPGMATAVGSMHPTGMHACYKKVFQ